MASYPGDVMLVTNHSDTDLTFKYDGRTIRIPPNKVGYVPFEFVVHELGHPASSSKEAKLIDPYGAFHMVPSREDERIRIQNKHDWNLGNPAGAMQANLSSVPDFTVQDQDGEEVLTVAQDPEGLHPMTASTQTPDVNDQIRRMEQQLKLLRTQSEPVPADAPDLATNTSQLPPSELLTDDE